jgi:S1-C subfamily serine protease
MSITESDPITPSEPLDGAMASPPRRRWRARSIVAAGAVGALVVACGVTGLVATARIVALQGQASSSSSSTGTNATLLPPRGEDGWGRSSSGGLGSMSRASETATGTAATAAQSVGIVLIATVLKYPGGEAAGTGIVLSSSGEILTNNHVIDGATSVTVTVVSTGKTYTAQVVGTDATRDIAVLKLEGASGLTPATTDSSSVIAVADAVTAVGNAGGIGTLTAATGTVTALDQSITAAGASGSTAERLEGLIETNADVVAGDSGGPLYDARGEVIGIDTAASAGTSATTGYAIPIATALGIVHQIESGAGTAQITIGYPAFLGIEIGRAATGTAGATIAGVVIGTPAATVGLAAGDTITAVDATSITSGTQLSALLASHRPGDRVTLTWTDAAGAAQSATVALVDGPAN